MALEPETKDLLITITDHGPGVPDEDRERLFGRFERGAGRPSGEGSGLGLYASRELCRAMGGDLELEPAEPGRGRELHGPAARRGPRRVVALTTIASLRLSYPLGREPQGVACWHREIPASASA